MTSKSSTNIILNLRKEGWNDTKISNFLAFIATHNPTEQEVFESSKLAQNH